MDPALASAETVAGGLEEAARLHWRADASERTLRRDGRRWTAWTAWIVFVFVVPGRAADRDRAADLPGRRDLLRPRLVVPWIQARRGARQVVPIGSERSAARRAAPTGRRGRGAGPARRPGRARGARPAAAPPGSALQRGALGAWLVGEQGAFLVRSRGRRVDCWCVRVADGATARSSSPAGRPGRASAARAARGRARVRQGRQPRLLRRALAGRRQLPERSRAALDAARRAVRR